MLAGKRPLSLGSGRMRRPAGPICAAILFAAFAFVVAGCGSHSPAGTTATTTTSASATGGTSTQATTTTSAAGKLAILTSANCRQLRNLTQTFAEAMAGSAQNLQQTAALVQQFAKSTPTDIRPDFQVLAAAWTKVASALKGVDLSSGKAPTANVLAKLVKLSSQLDAEQLTTASQDISAWANTNCRTKTE
jgi:hypothetical protein